ASSRSPRSPRARVVRTRSHDSISIRLDYDARRMRLPPARRLGATAILTVVLAATAPDARADVRLFRPLTADPRECQSRWRMSRYVEDWRYGTDVTDSTSRGGVVHDRVGISWEVSAGEVFRW